MIVLKVLLALILFLFLSFWCIMIIAIGYAIGRELNRGRKNGSDKSKRESL